ncbi:cytokine receptor-like factor 3 [Chrysoperla carnea]|uniref:cytokine receptor-like factor 3 n=1 Tax=Chrysoperla carnea TaxID=189513 RepID=UPI001D0875F8|nr:cytokine receptor-like factor 3 [Chrysoperla carnea]
MNEIITSTLKDANRHLNKLNEQNAILKKAIFEVEESAQNTIREIDAIFDKIKNQINNIIETKRNKLKENTKSIQIKSITPLKQCKKVIENEIVSTEKYILSGQHLLNTTDELYSAEFEEQSKKLGSLPAVPTIEEIPFISFQYDLNDLMVEFETRINNIGNISQIGPIQITQHLERPGGCLIEWSELEVDDNTSFDIQLYNLQRSYGDLTLNPELEVNFKDCYTGSNCFYLAKDMRCNDVYTFRVRCLTENSTIWSAWSRPYVVSTHLKPFMWSSVSTDYKLTNDNTIATKCSTHTAIIYSDSAQFYPNYSIEFTILESSEPSKFQCIGLIDKPIPEEKNIIRQGTFVLSTTGQLFVDGNEKLTQLPKLDKNSKVIFSSELMLPDKLRITVENQNKTVTYDWIVDDPEQPLYFAACMDGQPWKLLVE